MRITRILLLLFIMFWIYMMVGCPAYFDSRRSMVAYRHYSEAPSEQTQKEMDEARKLDRRYILGDELIMAAILATAIYGFIRAGRKANSMSRKHPRGAEVQ